ncbi:hypothetical protein DPMN_186520 [Dreissena polymorpha]|uniref:Uncharacterized protein n=1 Tax=Dreissena polymorpha TaxID=45954 RepID=A0A9D4I9E7_DREPO|nr:hypothetical protein DPMN_186520 [Dreissena polymorpha]
MVIDNWTKLEIMHLSVTLKSGVITTPSFSLLLVLAQNQELWWEEKVRMGYWYLWSRALENKE